MHCGRLCDIILRSNTEYAELLMSVISIISGFWLLTKWADPHFVVWGVSRSFPHMLGILLLLSGLFKFFGVYYSIVSIRKISCFLAALIWGILCITFIRSTVYHNYAISIPITGVLALFNTLTYSKLRSLRG
jgi:hypothetical protein